MPNCVGPIDGERDDSALASELAVERTDIILGRFSQGFEQIFSKIRHPVNDLAAICSTDGSGPTTGCDCSVDRCAAFVECHADATGTGVSFWAKAGRINIPFGYTAQPGIKLIERGVSRVVREAVS